MEKTWFAVLHAVLLLHCLAAACLANSVPNITSDLSSLLALKAHITFDPHGVLANNWSTATSICNWIGVTCGTTRPSRVTSLNISNMALEGTIPPHLGNLSFLVSLDLHNNNFSGQLPRELSHLRRLKFINLGVNKFSGQLPSWLGDLTELQQLLLANNSFTGTIPPSLSNASNLETLNFSTNFLQGMIPQEIGDLRNLKYLNAEFNQLTGSMPLTIFNMSLLQVIAFSDNGISGGLPTNMCHRLSNLQGIYLSHNELQGQIPSSLYECSQLQVLWLSYNKFSGLIPTGIGNSTVLKVLVLDRNNFKGEIPQEMGNLNLEFLSMEYAGLTGFIPYSIFNITTLKKLHLAGNNLTDEGEKMYFLSEKMMFSNYKRMRIIMTSYLKACDLWDVVGEEPKNGMSNKLHEKKEDKMLETIVSNHRGESLPMEYWVQCFENDEFMKDDYESLEDKVVENEEVYHAKEVEDFGDLKVEGEFEMVNKEEVRKGVKEEIEKVKEDEVKIEDLEEGSAKEEAKVQVGELTSSEEVYVKLKIHKKFKKKKDRWCACIKRMIYDYVKTSNKHLKKFHKPYTSMEMAKKIEAIEGGGIEDQLSNF
ncbi:receptor kinase-like protein Xa21 [Cornus florida]|uniref:receptor kinase-like protein Xa21 n=1 Tax=Cornus florida TaxID=4283 RepID=UPI00289DB2C7|nr:receptor kinase-like protein Xa21 [Cornus florida]